MGDLSRSCVDGRLVQYAHAGRLLAAPADAFVADFVGADRALKRLSLTTAGEAATAAPAPPDAPSVAASMSLRDRAPSLLLSSGADAVALAGGSVSLATICDRAAAPKRPGDGLKEGPTVSELAIRAISDQPHDRYPVTEFASTRDVASQLVVAAILIGVFALLAADRADRRLGERHRDRPRGEGRPAHLLRRVHRLRRPRHRDHARHVVDLPRALALRRLGAGEPRRRGGACRCWRRARFVLSSRA